MVKSRKVLKKIRVEKF